MQLADNCWTSDNFQVTLAKPDPPTEDQVGTNQWYTIQYSNQKYLQIQERKAKDTVNIILQTRDNLNASNVWYYDKNSKLVTFTDLGIDSCNEATCACQLNILGSTTGDAVVMTNNSIYLTRCESPYITQDSLIQTSVTVTKQPDTNWKISKVKRQAAGTYQIFNEDKSQILWYGTDTSTLTWYDVITTNDQQNRYQWLYDDSQNLSTVTDPPRFLCSVKGDTTLINVSKAVDPKTKITFDIIGSMVFANNMTLQTYGVSTSKSVKLTNSMDPKVLSSTDFVFNFITAPTYSPPESLPDGSYEISFNDGKTISSLTVDNNNNIILGGQKGNTTWIYDSTMNTLQLKDSPDPNKRYMGYQTSCGDSAGRLKLTMSQNSVTNRFLLAEDTLYDLTCNKCYIPSNDGDGSTSFVLSDISSGNFNTKLVNNTKNENKWLVWFILALMVLIIVGIIVFVAMKKPKIVIPLSA
jgi:hypothetical protein